MRCYNCKYYDEVGERNGWCYRYPPVMDMLAVTRYKDDDIYASTDCVFWKRPLVDCNDFCGEFIEGK